MKSNKFVSLILSFILIIGMVVPFAGCSYIENFFGPKKAITEYCEGVTSKFFKDLEKTLSDNSKKKITMPELTDEQMELAQYAYSGVTVELGEITVADDKESATVELTFRKLKECEDLDLLIGTMDEYQEAVDDLRTTRYTVELQVVSDGDDWIFKDLNSLVEVFYAPFADFCFLDADGNVINITDAYIEYVVASYSELYVDAVWYDVEGGNPLTETAIRSPYALQCVFYFNQLMTAEFEAELRCGTNVVATIDASMDGDVVVACDFPASGTFTPGPYTVALVYGGVEIAVSPALTVN